MTTALAKSVLLGEFSPDQCSTLLEFLDPREVDEGTALFHPSDESGELFLVLEGRVRLEIEGMDAGIVAEGDVLGAMSLVCISSRQCAAYAAEYCRLMVLSRTSYLRLRSDYPAVALLLQEAIVRYVSVELQSLLDRV